MAFSADELRVLRRALAQALQPSIRTGNTSGEVQDYLLLTDAVEEAAREGGRLRTFRSAELVRYRAALPGSAVGYLERLRRALESGYVPQPEDLAALRRLRSQPCTPAEERRRTSLLHHCERVAELGVRTRLDWRVPTPIAPFPPRRRLMALPGGRAAQEPDEDKGEDPGKGTETEKWKQQEKRERGGDNDRENENDNDRHNDRHRDRHNDRDRHRDNDRDNDRDRDRDDQKEREKDQQKEKGRGKGPAPEPGRRVPTPAEVWPPRRRPAPPAAEPREPRKPAPPTEQRRGA
jgi:hypothetical protein